jgi:ParB/RepB/Spo0J family partition protein
MSKKAADMGIDLARPSGQAADAATLIRLASTGGLPPPTDQYFTLPKEDFVLSDNIRTNEGLDDESLDGMRETIEQFGQIQPVLVSGQREDGKWKIEEGQRRYQAIMRSKKVTTIQFKLDDTLVQDQKRRLLIQLIANNQRANMGPLENATAHRVALAEFNNDRQLLCASLGISEPLLVRILGVSKSPPEVIEFVKRHHVGDYDAINNLAKLHATTPEKATEIMEAFDKSPDSFALRQVTKEALDNSRSKVPGAKKAGKDAEPVGLRGRAAKVDRVWVEEKGDQGELTLTLVAKGVKHRFNLTAAAHATLKEHFIPGKPGGGASTEGSNQSSEAES